MTSRVTERSSLIGVGHEVESLLSARKEALHIPATGSLVPKNHGCWQRSSMIL